jgi:hypothetical protein
MHAMIAKLAQPNAPSADWFPPFELEASDGLSNVFVGGDHFFVVP